MKRIVCLGGGPAGLYSASLFKKALPQAKVEVYERNRADRRSATVRVTRKGREAFLKMAAANERWMDDMFADLSAAQIEQLMRLLSQVRRSIDAHAV